MAQRVDASGQGGFPVTPSDTLNIALPTGMSFTKGIYVAGSGNLRVIMSDGTDVTFTSIAGGMIHPISAIRVMATGTTATGIVAVY
ncbi:hypothetical protein ACFQ3J_00400 [Paenibacillus provencensis]|uniref:Uncharacterized protein n=1 Tax=Paenibacillus provencensis TaxID=441151 RepID=A0ABW3PH27_9BACL|nr:hypothetical protein [Paenibacillus sp. MER 78]MCM3130946.1 hypothetical protein [Paenibacillus sp. MER 78]